MQQKKKSTLNRQLSIRRLSGFGKKNVVLERKTFPERMVPEVIPPPRFPLDKELWDKNQKPRLDVLKKHLLLEGRLSRASIRQLLNKCTALLKKEPNVLKLHFPITICGDIHGQFFDLNRLFEIGGDPQQNRYLFLGDYVDRGCFSTEVVFYLWALKITYPKNFYLLRGNHESRQMTSFFNFKNECIYKYNLNVYKQIMKSFDALPLAAVIGKYFFCVHGGISPDMTNISQLRTIRRFKENPREGPMCDLLWSDPYDENAWYGSDEGDEGDEAPEEKNLEVKWYDYNQTRQCSYVYGMLAVKHFLKKNKLTCIIRAHEAQNDGYRMQWVNQATGAPRVITVFTAPNYCDAYNNRAAILKFDNAVLNIKQFTDSPHPYYLDKFMDAFQWSMPFVVEKLLDIIYGIVLFEADEKDSQNPEEQVGHLKTRLRAVTKVLRMYRLLKLHEHKIARLKELTHDNLLPFGILQEGEKGIDEKLSGFEKAKKADLSNEMMPGAKPTSGKRRDSDFKPRDIRKLTGMTTTHIEEVETTLLTSQGEIATIVD